MSSSNVLADLHVFDHKSQDWNIFLSRLEQILRQNSDIEDDHKCALLLTHLSDDTYRLVNDLVYPRKLEAVTYTELNKVLDDHFKRKHCVLADRARFYEAKMTEGESIEDWAARVRGLAVHCLFESSLDKIVMDKFVLGLSAGPEKDRLFEQDATTLTFSMAVKLAQANEVDSEEDTSVNSIASSNDISLFEDSRSDDSEDRPLARKRRKTSRSDRRKYEVARKLDNHIDRIRELYRSNWKSYDMKERQRGVVLYLIDQFGLRIGHETGDAEANTVGCCSLRVEHIKLHEEKDGKRNVVEIDFFGKGQKYPNYYHKSSVRYYRYYNEVTVERHVFKNLKLFMENKKDTDDVFHRLSPEGLKRHLWGLMPRLSAMVFHTYNASITLQRQLDELTDGDASFPEKVLQYHRARDAVAELCNLKRAEPKCINMKSLKDKIIATRKQVEEAEADYFTARRDFHLAAKSTHPKQMSDLIYNETNKEKVFEQVKEQLKELKLLATYREENKINVFGTANFDYLDPRISVAWCKKNDVRIRFIFDETQRQKFNWAINTTEPDFVF